MEMEKDEGTVDRHMEKDEGTVDRHMEKDEGTVDRHGVSVVQAALRALAAGASAADALDLIIEHARLLLPASEVMVLLLRDNQLILHAGQGIAGAHLPRLSFADGASVERWVATRDTALFVPDVSIDPRFRAAALGKNRIMSLAVMPIRVEGAVAGVLEIGDEYQVDFRGNSVLLTMLADAAGIVVEYARTTQRSCDLAAEETLRAIRHDVRSPLTAINGYAQLLRRRATRENRDADVQTAAIIMQQVQRITAMLDALRDATPEVGSRKSGVGSRKSKVESTTPDSEPRHHHHIL
jgi:GAF domain-containing protein